MGVIEIDLYFMGNFIKDFKQIFVILSLEYFLKN